MNIIELTMGKLSLFLNAAQITIKIHIGVECTSYWRMNSKQSQLLINLATCSDCWEFPLTISSRLSTPPPTSVKQIGNYGRKQQNFIKYLS